MKRSPADPDTRVVQRSWSVASADQGIRLDAFLLTRLSDLVGRPVGRPIVRRLIVAGAIALNGVRSRVPGRALGAGDRVAALVDVERVPHAPSDARWHISAADIIFEDEWILALNKPAGLPTVPTADRRRSSVVDSVREWLRSRAGASIGAAEAEPYVGVHHRLDQDTTGLLVVALRPEANASLSTQFASHDVRKVYRALTVRPPSVPTQPVVVESHIEGRPARTELQLIRARRAALLMEARPETGRKHQVRIHLAEAGFPILGDVQYGGPRRVDGQPVPRVMLHAARLSLAHPVSGTALHLSAPLPADFEALWRAADRRHRS